MAVDSLAGSSEEVSAEGKVRFSSEVSLLSREGTAAILDSSGRSCEKMLGLMNARECRECSRFLRKGDKLGKLIFIDQLLMVDESNIFKLRCRWDASEFPASSRCGCRGCGVLVGLHPRAGADCRIGLEINSMESPDVGSHSVLLVMLPSCCGPSAHSKSLDRLMPKES
jgi:hypothetical protein